MNEKQNGPVLDDGGGDGDLRELLERAGPRPPVPPGDFAAIKASARRDWRDLVADQATEASVARPARRRGRWAAAPLALAATLIIALAAGLWWRSSRPAPTPVVVATVERAAGATLGGGAALAAGAELPRGAEIETRSAGDDPVRVALRLAGGQSLRVDAGSRATLIAADVVALRRGAVYVDSASDGRSLEVRTPLGSVRDIGTQFEVRLAEGAAELRVRVRQGSVEIARGGESLPAATGEELTLGADGSLERQTVAPWDADWRWVLEAAPGPKTEGLRLDGYLAWLSRETGWRIRFSDAELARAAAETAVQFSTIGDLTPEESVHVVLPASGFEYQLHEGVLVIRP